VITRTYLELPIGLWRVADYRPVTKTSSIRIRPASKRVGKGFAAKDNKDFDTQCRINVISPPASSEADLGLAELGQAGTEIKTSGGIEKMKSRLIQIALLSVSMLALVGTAAAQGRGRIDRGERRELRADRVEVRADTRDIRSDRRDIREDVRDRRGDVREYRQDKREGASQAELRADRQEVKGDTQDLHSDRHDIRGDFRDRRGDVRDYRQDRREARRN
jgi:hypothetical protein